MTKRREDGGASCLRRVASGDENALEEVYACFGGSLYRYLLTLVGDRQLAEEVLQDTLVAVWRGASSFEGRSSVKTWIFGIARRRAYDALRRRNLPLLDEDALQTLHAHEPEPEAVIVSSSSSEEIARQIERLSPVHREILALIFFHELSYEETAKVLEVPIGTVKSRLSNAKKSLRKMMQAPESEGP